MAHCPVEKLTDLEGIFEVLRTWKGLKEKKTGTFYYKGKGFLHFHIKDERRWADIRDGEDWGESFDIDFEPNAETQALFLKEIKRRFDRLG